MPKRAVTTGTQIMRRAKIAQLQGSIDELVKEAELLLSKEGGQRADELSPEHVDSDPKKLSTLVDCIVEELYAYDEACDALASVLDSETLEGSDEALQTEICDVVAYSVRIRGSIVECKRSPQYRAQTNRPEAATTSTSSPSSTKSTGSAGIKQETSMVDLSSIQQSIGDLVRTQSITHSQHQQVLQSQEDLIKQHQLVVQHMQASSPQPQPAPTSSVNLPKFEIPTFSGDFLKWAEFHDMFVASIDANQGLSGVQKLSYLRDHVTGLARDAIAGLPISDTNYTTALDILRKRFGNDQLRVNAHYTAIMDLPPASNATPSLRRLHDALEVHLRSLTALGENVNQAVFVSMITNKLPRTTLAALELKKGPQSWTVSDLRAAVANFIIANEAADRLSQPPKKSHESPSASASGQSLVASASATSKAKPKRVCVFCSSEAHFSDECNKYTTVEARKSVAKQRCFKCLRSGHSVHDCSSKRRCFYCHNPAHHSSLCPDKFTAASTQRQASTMSPNAQSFKPKPATSTVANADHQIMMQTAVAPFLSSKLKPINGRILFDTGSTKTYITQAYRDQLDLPTIGNETLSLATFGNNKRKSTVYAKVSLTMQCKDGSTRAIQASVLPNITAPIARCPLASSFPLLQSLPLAEPLSSSAEPMVVDVLIGLDHYYDIIGKDRTELSGGLVLLDSVLGFICTGSLPVPATTEAQSCLAHQTDTDPEFDLRKFWSTESLGTFDDTSSQDLVGERFANSISFAEGRYAVSWPWRDSHPPLPTNYGLAFGRLKAQVRRLEAHPELLDQYDTVIQDQLDRGMIEDVPRGFTTNQIHYLPHHSVLKPTATTTKLRVVYDASAKCSEKLASLNDCLHAGPNLVPDLCGILLRFRLSPVAISGDVEKAFLQIGLHSHDRDVTRFLWLHDASSSATPDNIRQLRFCRVPFGVVSSPYLLAATIQHHLSAADTTDSDLVSRNIYVDNLFLGANSGTEAIAIYDATKRLFSVASMNVREWSSNSAEFLSSIPEPDRAKGTIHKCLGMLWDTEHDTLHIAPVSAVSKSATTKRSILRHTAQFFDPLGLQSPVLVGAKILLQDLWKLNVGWDDDLPQDIICRWCDIAAQLELAASTKCPRFISAPRASDARFSLHVFSDASGLAYGAVAYLTTTFDDQHTSNLLISKSRVAPVASPTIPRLELMAALLGVRLIQFVRRELPLTFSSTFLWSDSTTVLHWLASSDKLPVFVNNRIDAIRAVPDVAYRYVRSADNPADLPSRGVSVPSLQASSLWWHGPHFLATADHHAEPALDHHVNVAAGEGPSSTSEIPAPVSHPTESTGPDTELAHEMKKKPDAHHEQKKTCDEPPFGIDCARFSSFSALVRVSALCLRFLSRLRPQGGKSFGVDSSCNSEVKVAKIMWLHHAQQNLSDVSAVENCKKHSPKDKLRLFLDENRLIRCRGRLENAELCYQAKYPVLIPQTHPITQLIINDCHLMTMHGGVAHTLSRLRYEYWLPRGRATVKSFITKCLTCRKHHGGPYRTPDMAPLPSARATRSIPFTHVGLDYFGPLLVKHQPSTKKVWVLLVTCMATRAVHLELVADMTTEEFLLAFRRFVSLRGCPEEVVSDNAPQFILAKSVLDVAFEEMATSDDVLSYMSRTGVKWHYNPPISPWMGGFYERLVGTVKRSLKKVVGRALLTVSQLTTILMEVSAVVNSRPLVYVDNDLQEILTPSHFLCLSATTGGVQPTADDGDPDHIEVPTAAQNLLSVWKKGQRTLDQFWRVWRDDYLADLRNSHTRKLRQARVTASEQPAVDDVVLIRDDMPRGSWRLGRIVALHTSKDMEIRSATVITAEKTELKRPLSLLYPICPAANSEANNNSTAPDTHTTGQADLPVPAAVAPHSRPQRAAAKKQRQTLRQLIGSELV
ncbi:uncharacterized protein LOC135810600 [Sycon ciliatum]|uniref:uncharacterized protein LOC135810600 n=1 Tax=Sycon ciliatum TaxID=27933 RepID=UPI0031F6DE69